MDRILLRSIIIILLFIFILNIGDDKVKREQECEESGLEAETGELDLSRPRTSSGAVIMSSSSTTTICLPLYET